MTLKEIAGNLNLSYSTVSAVMRGRGEELHIAPATVKRVRKAAEEFGYKPNLAARALRNNRSYNIGILLPSPRDLSYAVMVAEIQHCLAETEYTGIFSFWESEDKIQSAIDNILKYNIEGLITNEPAHLPENLKIPVVSYYNEDPRFDFVGYDHYEVAFETLDYLDKLGHRSIGVVCLKDSYRTGCIRQIIRERGMKEAGTWYIDAESNKIEGLAEVFASGNNIPDAIVAGTDEAAMLTIQYATDHGIAVPRDLSVAGCNDNWIARLSAPALTTICRTAEPFGHLLAETLFKRLENPNGPRIRQITKSTLTERNSCAKHKRR